MIAKIDCITRYEIRQYIEKGDKFLLVRGGFKTKIDALKAVKTMLDNGVYAKDTLGVTESQYANEERIKQDFPICQLWYWSDWFNGYDTLVKMIAFKESEENEKNHFNNSRRI